MTNITQIDERLLDFATPRQAEIIFAINKHGGQRAAARATGWSQGSMSDAIKSVEKKAARAGYAPGHFADGVAPGYRMGKVTVQRGPNGVERVWERQHPAEDALAVLREAMAAAIEDAKGALPATPAPLSHDADLLTVIPMGDPHFGLMTWAKEVGEDFDLKIAETLTFAAVDRLCALTPSSDVAMLLNLGDFYHADNGTNRTPTSGANLDVDGRFQLIAQVGFRAMCRCIRRMLEKHAKVIVRNNRGNHDPHQAFMLSVALDAMFHDEPRVTVEMTPASFYYYRFGKTLIGSTHGDGAKLGDLPLIMATDVPQDWAAATWRVWHCGHFHHDQLKDHPGCTVETHRTLATNDAWHKHNGYRSGRDMKAVIYHREHGEISRIRCGISQLQAH
jgi:molybdenum-dependent DNA-binding transcriptional regulator ModE